MWAAASDTRRALCEGAHIRPLGAPHDGPDTPDNILCLCPNHHVLFDQGAFHLGDDLVLIGLGGRLRTIKGHTINPIHHAYHRHHMGLPSGSPAQPETEPRPCTSTI